MKTLLLLPAVILSMTFFVSAQECSQELGLVNSLLEKANLEQALTDPDAIVDDYNELKGSLGSIGLSSLKKDAPKILFLNGKEKKGRIKKGERRMFVTSLISKETLHIQFSNPGLLENTEIIICSHSTKGETQNLTHFTIDESNVSDTFEFDFSDVKGKVVSITVRNVNNPERMEFSIAAN
tara:strand:- start:29949 stop:30491 length:543 start_codon:yes stop_codon:yes gene_type:complete